jgi:hypothetical protein
MRKSFPFIFVIIPLFLINVALSAQYDHQSVLPELEGAELLNAIVENFKPAIVLTYGQARDTMFAKIDAKNDSLECVYSGHKLYLDPTQDPTTYVYLDGIDDGINTEHTYPRSKGAENGNARSDMHHLYPTRIRVNSDRGNLPFQDIPDEQTQSWYYLNGEQSNTPQSNIDAYSEGTSEYFEPREAHKGNVARSVFYFYTMYNEEAMAADPDFFSMQNETLCNWHYLDPVDSLEWERTFAIAEYQDGRANPFVLDCTLAARTYCDMVSDACTLVNTNEKEEISEFIHVFPNPAEDIVQLNFNVFEDAEVGISVYRADGKLMLNSLEKLKAAEENSFTISTNNLKSGLYILKIIFIYKNKQAICSTSLVIK